MKIESLDDISPFVQEYLLPHIQQSVAICINCYLMDTAFNDTWTFGTQFWRNTWNRFKTVAKEVDECPFEIYGNESEYKLKLSSYVIRHHRINTKSKLPSGAKAAKLAAYNMQQMYLFNDWSTPVEKENVIIAIDADINNGLKEVFIGEIMPLEKDSKKYKWVNKAPVFLADGAEASTSDIFDLMEIGPNIYIPEEEIPEISLTLDKSKGNVKALEGEGGNK